MPPNKRRRRRRNSSSSSSPPPPPPPPPPPHAPSPQQLRTQVAQQAARLRRNSVSPNTIFLPRLPPHIHHRAHIDAILPTPAQSVSLTTSAAAPRIAWITFSSEQHCMHALLHLRTVHPDLCPTFHNRTAAPTHHHRARLFDQRLAKLAPRGALGNTLIFRNVPAHVHVPHFSTMLADLFAASSLTSVCHVLRVRAAAQPDPRNASRTFWVVFSSVNAARCAFVATYNARVHFPTAPNVRLNVFLHDDSTDAGHHSRRRRAIAMRLVPNPDRILPDPAPAAAHHHNVAHLERYLTHLGPPLYFLHPHT